jgi:hypothetical protein
VNEPDNRPSLTAISFNRSGVGPLSRPITATLKRQMRAAGGERNRSRAPVFLHGETK